MLDVLLIQSRSPLPITAIMQKIVNIAPLGLQFLSSILKKEKFSVIGINLLSLREEIEKFKSTLKKERPKVIGISSMTETYNNVFKIAKLCKICCPDCKIVLGGPHVTFFTDDALKDENIDFVVRKEGEISFLKLVNTIINKEGSLEAIKGISFKNNGNIIHNNDCELIQDLDSLPYPDRDLFEDKSLPAYPDRFKKFASISTTRGCSGKCIFCAAAALSGSKYRIRSAESIIEEIEMLKKNNKVNLVFFVDDTFTLNRKRLITFCELMINKKINIRWTAEARIDTLSNEILKLMKKAGVIGLQFGVESGSQTIVNEIRKNIDLVKVEKYVKYSTEIGIEIACSFIIGHPYDTKKTISETVGFADMLQTKYKARCLASALTPFPGTYLYNHMDELGIKLIDDNWDNFTFNNPVIETKHLSNDEIRAYHFDALIKLSNTRFRDKNFAPNEASIQIEKAVKQYYGKKIK